MNPPSYLLIMQSGPNVGKQYPLDQDVIFVGRDLQNDIVVSDAEVSRRHARLTRLPNGVYEIEDLGSTNGTFVNGRRLTGKQTLARGDVVMMGSKVLFEVELQVADPNATVVSTPPLSTEHPQPQPVAPAEAPPPQAEPAFVGRMPQSPGATDQLSPPNAKKQGLSPGLLIGCGALLVLCCAITAGVLWYIDSNYLWCTVLPILPGCP